MEDYFGGMVVGLVVGMLIFGIIGTIEVGKLRKQAIEHNVAEGVIDDSYGNVEFKWIER